MNRKQCFNSCNSKEVKNKTIAIVKTTVDNQSFDYVIENRIVTAVYKTKASIKTKPYSTWFSVNNIESSVSHIFTVRYSKLLENYLGNEYTIIYKNVSYDIVAFENKNEENKEVIIHTKQAAPVEIPNRNIHNA